MAKIKIDREHQIGPIDRRIYSGFIEHLGRCIYGGIFDKHSPLSDEHGFRRDVIDALRGLKNPVLRWPGGNFVSGYHWLDGVGPVEERPRRMELAWRVEESNRFGTNEFLHYCELLSVEPYICVNMGSGTMDEAQAWVEYCNGEGNTYWANLRRKHGREEPYKVRYWGLGNEMYGDWQIGSLSVTDYVKKAREFAKVMKWIDPTIQLVSCGLDGLQDWDRIVIEELARLVDFHSIHIYTGSDDYYSNVFSVHQSERALRNCRAMIDQVRYQQKIQHPIHVVYDEWNIWFREDALPNTQNQLEERYTLADALAIATYLNIFIRHCRTVKMANLAQMVNVIAPIVTNKEGLFLQTIYAPLQLYATYMQGNALDIHVESETHELRVGQDTSRWQHRVADLGPFKFLDAAAAYDDAEHMLTLAVVNRDLEHSHTSTIHLMDMPLPNSIALYEVNGTHANVMNSFEHPSEVRIQESTLEPVAQNLAGQHLQYTFPAHSLTLMRMRLE
ncbi:MAG: alpha-N-arabinofuranosidase [Ktedonobacteraceae bacterium]